MNFSKKYLFLILCFFGLMSNGNQPKEPQRLFFSADSLTNGNGKCIRISGHTRYGETFDSANAESISIAIKMNYAGTLKNLNIVGTKPSSGNVNITLFKGTWDGTNNLYSVTNTAITCAQSAQGNPNALQIAGDNQHTVSFDVNDIFYIRIYYSSGATIKSLTGSIDAVPN